MKTARAIKENSVNFSYEIERLAKDRHMSYIDAVVHYSEEHGVEIEVIAKMVSGALKSKIKIEAENLNYLPKNNSAKLPL